MTHMTAAQHRDNARASLGGNIFHNNWLNSLLAALLVSAIPSLASSFTCGIGSIILFGPFLVGGSIFFLKLARTGTADIGRVFDGLSGNNFGKTLLLGLMTSIFTFLWSLLFVIPGIVKSYAYAMAPYLMADHPDWGWQECIDKSRQLMQGRKMDLFLLDLSFIGWILVGSLACGIGTLWVTPYMMAARTSFYEAAVSDQPTL